MQIARLWTMKTLIPGRRRAMSVSLCTGFVLAMGLGVAPAGAQPAAHFPPHGAEVRAHDTTRANTYVPLNNATATVTDVVTGDNTYTSAPGSVGPATGPCPVIPSGGNPTEGMCMDFGSGDAIIVAPPSGQSLSAGQVYDTSTAIVIVSVDGHHCGTDLNGDAAAEVDQYVLSPDKQTITSAAVQFTCTDDNVSISGSVAYNIVPTTPGQGYYMFGQAGELTGFGNDNYLVYLGDLSQTTLNAPIVGMAITPDGGGYWMVGADGGVFAYGDAGFYGSTNLVLNQPVVGMAATPDGHGYWFVAADGGVFAYGDAQFFGSTGNIVLNQPVVGMTPTPDGNGYWFVAADGGVFAYGDAGFYGSTGNIALNQPVVGMTATPDGKGYWFVAADGGVFAYGDAGFYGSTGNLRLSQPVVGMTATPDGKGYWFVASDGGLFSYGSAAFAGSLGGLGVTDVAGIATSPVPA